MFSKRFLRGPSCVRHNNGAVCTRYTCTCHPQCMYKCVSCILGVMFLVFTLLFIVETSISDGRLKKGSWSCGQDPVHAYVNVLSVSFSKRNAFPETLFFSHCYSRF